MESIKKYIEETLGIDILIDRIPPSDMGSLPVFIAHYYRFFKVELLHRSVILLQPKHEGLSVLQTSKNFDQIKKTGVDIVVLVLPEISAVNRGRLIEKGINFIVPSKQLYLPDLLLDLRESFSVQRNKRRTNKMLPSAQFLLIYHILHRHSDWQLENHSFKEIAEETGYSAMAITKAVENLAYHDFIEVCGEREKSIRFLYDRPALWASAEQQHLLINPVIKKVYADEEPQGVFALFSNESALPEYSDMNPSKQKFYAMDKSTFYGLRKSNSLPKLNDEEGPICIEVWRYNPKTIVEGMPNELPVVDPLSLYLSLKESHDERIDMALDQIIERNIW